MRIDRVYDGSGNVISSVEVHPTTEELHSRNREMREKIIEVGPTFDGINAPADTRTIVFFQGLYPLALANSDFTYEGYRANNGTFTLTAAQIIGLHNAGFVLIRDTFLTYNANEAAINEGTMTTLDALEAAYNGQ